MAMISTFSQLTRRALDCSRMLCHEYMQYILKPQALIQIQTRGMKDVERLTLRCKFCYFKEIDGRWHVMCTHFGRHKQREKIIDIRRKWIVTSYWIGGRRFGKRHMYPGHNL